MSTQTVCMWKPGERKPLVPFLRRHLPVIGSHWPETQPLRLGLLDREPQKLPVSVLLVLGL